MQVLVVLVGHNAVQVASHRAHVAVDGPLVVVQHHNHALGLLSDVVHRFKRNAVGECGISGNGDHMLMAAGQVASHGHSQRCRKSGACVARAVAIVLALSAQHKAVQAARLANGIESIDAAGQQFVHVGLVAHVKKNPVFRRVEHRVQRDRKLHNAEIRPQVAAGLRKRLNKALADLFGKSRHLRGTQLLYVRGRVD